MRRLLSQPAAAWTASNPTLGLGIPAHETDTGKVKVGTGALAWTALPYVGSGGGGVTEAEMDAAIEAAIDDAIAAHLAASDPHSGYALDADLATHALDFTRHTTDGENDALAGTTGTPSAANRYVTQSDPAQTNARTPTAHTHGLATADITGILTGAKGGTAADLTATAGNRVFASPDGVGGMPTMRALLGGDLPNHGTRHSAGGADAIKLDDFQAPDDNTDTNASTSAHGLLRKLSGVATQYLDGSGAFSVPPTSDARVALQSLSADQAAIGTTATVIASFTRALSAGTRYRIRAIIQYLAGTTTAVFAARATYSGTLSGTSSGKTTGTTGATTVWAAVPKINIIAVNAAIPTTTAGFGATGSTSAIAQVEMEVEIETNTAGNFNIEVVSSAASGFVPKRGSSILFVTLP